MRQYLKWLIVATLTALLAACGGGGSGGNSDGNVCLAASCQGSSSSSSSSGGTNVGSLTFTTTVATGSGAKVFDNINDAIQVGSVVTLKTVVKTASGKVVPGVVVKYTASSTLLSLSAESSLTDSNGVTTIDLSTKSTSATGAVTVTAAVSSDTAGVTASNDLSFRLTSSGVGSTAAYVSYLSASTKRLFVRSGSSGVNSAAEQTTLRYQVLDASAKVVPNINVTFDVPKLNRNGGVLICPSIGSSTVCDPNNVAHTQALTVKSSDAGIVDIVVRSGTEPMSFNVQAWLTADGSASAPPGDYTKSYYSDTIVVSVLRPDQSKAIIQWESGATCLDASKPRAYPCNWVVTLGDKNGQPVPDGTVVNLVSSTGVIVADTLAGQPSGACLTVSSQCKGKYFGKSEIALGAHAVVIYTIGDRAPASSPVTFDGSWVANATSSNVRVAVPDSDNYIRNCMRDDGAALSSCVPVNVE